LDPPLSLGGEAGVSPKKTSPPLRTWRGAVSPHQQPQRARRGLLANDRRKEVIALYEELEAASRRLAGLALASPEPAQLPDWRKQIARWSDRREKMRTRAASLSANFHPAPTRHRPPPGPPHGLLSPAGHPVPLRG